VKIALLRIGVDTGTGGIHGPLFQDRSFEYIPIPDGFGVDHRTYGNVVGRHGHPLASYFPFSRRAAIARRSVHLDPEFETFTYGDPTRPKAGLSTLTRADLLVFYGGLQGWDFVCDPSLYLFGYFEVEAAGRADDFVEEDFERSFSANFHVRHRAVFEQQRNELVLVKGSPRSRLLQKAVRISEQAINCAGQPLHILSADMRRIFGDFGGHVSIQRSPTRWVAPEFVEKAAMFVRGLR